MTRYRALLDGLNREVANDTAQLGCDRLHGDTIKPMLEKYALYTQDINRFLDVHSTVNWWSAGAEQDPEAARHKSNMKELLLLANERIAKWLTAIDKHEKASQKRQKELQGGRRPTAVIPPLPVDFCTKSFFLILQEIVRSGGCDDRHPSGAILALPTVSSKASGRASVT